MINLTKKYSQKQIIALKMLGYIKWVPKHFVVKKIAEKANNLQPSEVEKNIIEQNKPTDLRSDLNKIVIQQVENNTVKNRTDSVVRTYDFDQGCLLADCNFTFIYNKENKAVWILPALFCKEERFFLFMDETDIELLISVLKYTHHMSDTQLFLNLRQYQQEELPLHYNSDQLKATFSHFEIQHLLILGSAMLQNKITAFFDSSIKSVVVTHPSLANHITTLKYHLWRDLENYKNDFSEEVNG